MPAQTQPQTQSFEKRNETATLNRLGPALFALLFGGFLILGVGFAQPSTLHNAAHDGRHALAFPCH
jgi:cobalt transporter subunit CbtB